MDFNSLAADFENSLISMNKNKARSIFKTIEKFEDRIFFIENSVVPALRKIGECWESGETSLAQVYMSGKICEEIIGDFSCEAGMRPAAKPKIGIATLEDHHCLGKRIVSSVVRSAGYHLTDFGHGISALELSKAAFEAETEILLVSVLMLHSALKISELKKFLAASGAKTRIIAGGAPFIFDDSLWKNVGADASGRGAFDAVRLIKEQSERTDA